MMNNIKNYYLGTPVPTYEFMRLPITIIPEKLYKNYLKGKSVDGWVYLEIWKGVYGIK